MTDIKPDSYGETLAFLKRQVHEARFAVQRQANTGMLRLYWRISDTILARQRIERWGTGVLTRLATAPPSRRLPGHRRALVGDVLESGRGVRREREHVQIPQLPPRRCSR